jgi:hypothetical protein
VDLIHRNGDCASAKAMNQFQAIMQLLNREIRVRSIADTAFCQLMGGYDPDPESDVADRDTGRQTSIDITKTSTQSARSAL